MDDTARNSTAPRLWDVVHPIFDLSGLRILKPEYSIDARLRLCEQHFAVLPGLHSRRGDIALGRLHTLAALESLTYAASTRAAFDGYLRLALNRAPTRTWVSDLPRAPWRDECLRVVRGRVSFVRGGVATDLAQPGADEAGLLCNLMARERGPEPLSPTLEAFIEAVDELSHLSLIAPCPGAVAWGDLARREPFCGRYGGTRGTIVDRYYLAKFIEATRHLIRGRVVEVGTSMLTDDNCLGVEFPAATQYRTLDVLEGPGVDICGDLGDLGLLAPGTVDSILCFNVLEHCAEAQRAVNNMLAWLSPGGKVFCMVPSVQRVHDAPSDYWRPMPAGLDHMFRNYSRRELYIYGNLQTTIAALAGLAIEDMSPDVLDTHHPDYPVASCIVATK